jgi:hypothetical protein
MKTTQIEALVLTMVELAELLLRGARHDRCF